MQKNSYDFSIADLLQKADTPSARQLLAMLQSSEGATLEQAAEKVRAGDYEGAGKILQTALSSPEAKELLKNMGG